jgi:subtilisin family serine protease
MRRRTVGLICVIALGATAPIGIANAQTPDPAKPEKADLEEEVVESTTGSYIVVMREEPLVADIAQDDLDTPTAQVAAAELEAQHDQVLAEENIDGSEKVQGYTNALNGFSATLTHEEAERLAANPKVAKVIPDELRQLDTDSSVSYLGLTSRGGAWRSGITGEGVVVGIIDSGIWPEHPSFADDGSYPAPPVVLDDVTRPACEFGNEAHNPIDVPFTCNNKLIGARQMLDTYRALIGADPGEFDSARDDIGHGTHTASTAAGNFDVDAEIFGNDLGAVSGIAPRAHVIAYKGLGDLGGFTSDLVSAIDQAVADGVDVINYSIGGGPGIDGADSIAFLFAADAGVFVATSAGNSGDGASTIGGPGDAPWITTVAASTQYRFWAGTAVLSDSADDDRSSSHGWHGWFEWWKHWNDRDVVRITGASVTPGTGRGRLPLVDAEFAGGDLCIPGTLDPALVGGNIVLCRRGAIARAAKSQAVYQAGGAGMIMYNNSDVDNLFTDNHWVPSVHMDYSDGIVVKQHIADSDEPTAKITNTADDIHIDYDPSITIFSSRGPNPSSFDVIKPDITAPGLQIVAGNTPSPIPGAAPPGELFQAISGTSMSSPHVAGLFALLKQAHPDWSAAAARSALMTTAYEHVLDNDRVSPADVFDTGSGHVDPGRVNDRGSSFNPGMIYDAGLFEYAAFTCGVDAGIFTPGTCDFLESVGVPIDPSDLNYPSIAVAELAGSQTIVRTITSVADEPVYWKAYIDAPDGYDVTVTPRRVTLQPGETATYEVTIANDGTGPVGEWRFGDIEWKGGWDYSARSPIAVRGAALDAPPQIEGDGTAGSAGFDVSFGYTGAYAAAGHGLAANEPITGSIGQDPDQTYPSADDAPGPEGGVDRIDIVLTDTAFLRLALDISGPDDIDLYLEDSGGTVIAQSTAGGSNELIELTQPGDDTYTLVVHGWSVPSAPLAYAIDRWIVSNATDGSLMIDSAPAAAVTGASGTVEVGWSGLETSQQYLGAVSHSDASGVLALTLVEVGT